MMSTKAGVTIFLRTRQGICMGVVMAMCSGLIACSRDAPSPAPTQGVTTRAVLQTHDDHSFHGRHGLPFDGGTADAGSTLNEDPILSDFVLYAERSVTLGKNDRVSDGDIGVAALAAPSYGPQLTVGNVSFVDPGSDLLAASVQLDSGAIVGDVETSLLTNDGGQLRLLGVLPSPMPPLPLAAASTPGTTNVTVDRFHAQRLAPGAYGTLTVNGVLFLEPGTFFFSSVTVGDGAHRPRPAGDRRRVARWCRRSDRWPTCDRYRRAPLAPPA